ncbi:hypothetical protein [Bradyrhizobium sp. URHD0069]|uniref:hypothetical protein n=1 Tax=Bradyrhizobium sp. URHD0069 TaxID=1380355 RepID=UPI0004956EC1|nr:hypothetical protein [Bradyrhizobium sp. URHD0069]
MSRLLESNRRSEVEIFATQGCFMKYGSIEYQYAAPIAQALVDDPDFRRWVLSKSVFAEFVDARILNKEIGRHRSNPTAEWWRFHFTEKCRCDGCSGKETDIFTIFESASGVRFALHFEIKQPKDKFKQDGIQSRGYPLRAQCWADKPPAKVLPHQRASTGIFFSEEKREEYEPHLQHFKTLITFEEIEREFPHLAVWHATLNGNAAAK